jgi:hypothetical protein
MYRLYFITSELSQLSLKTPFDSVLHHPYVVGYVSGSVK